MLLKLAWRNIWRNKRRTFITAASILFAVFFASFVRSIQKGTWDNMIDNVVNFYFGYAQIHQDGYWAEQSLDKAFPIDKKLQALPAEIGSLEEVVPRIESFALASFETNTHGVLVVGIDPSKENAMTKLSSRVTEGKYLADNDQDVMIGVGVAEKLGMQLGDTLVLISQGYHGVNAAGKYAVKGLVKFGSPNLNKQLVYLPLAEAQYFYGAEGLVTSAALKIKSKSEVDNTVKAVKASLPAGEYEVLNWEQMIPELVEARELDTASNMIILFILYILIAFGIFGTVLMMVKEREYEFGVLTAIGMKRGKLAGIIWLETLIIGTIGTILGILFSAPIVYYFHKNPIDTSGLGEEYTATYEKFGMEPVLPAAFEWSIFTEQAIIVFFIVTLMAIYPFWQIWKLKPVEAMRG